MNTNTAHALAKIAEYLDAYGATLLDALRALPAEEREPGPLQAASRDAIKETLWIQPPPMPRATALHACLACGRHPETHRRGGDDGCPMCGLGDEREAE